MDYLFMLSIWLSGISGFFSINYLLAYYRAPEQTYSFRLSSYLVAADLIFALGKLMTIFGSSYYVCQLQAILINYGQLASVFWTFFICFTLKRNLFEQDHSLEAKEKTFILLGFGMPLIFSIM
jgi:hypothetical protein